MRRERDRGSDAPLVALERLEERICELAAAQCERFAAAHRTASDAGELGSWPAGPGGG